MMRELTGLQYRLVTAESVAQQLALTCARSPVIRSLGIMTIFVLAFLCLVASHCSRAAAVECDPLSYNDIATRINADLPSPEGVVHVVTAIYYTCFVHGTDVTKLHSFVVTVNTTLDPSKQSHFLFQCQTAPSTYSLPLELSVSVSTVVNVTFDSYCGSCNQNSDPVCQRKFKFRFNEHSLC